MGRTIPFEDFKAQVHGCCAIGVNEVKANNAFADNNLLYSRINKGFYLLSFMHTHYIKVLSNNLGISNCVNLQFLSNSFIFESDSK
jgi:hypothetical protein